MNEKVNARIEALEAELAGLKKELAEPKKEGRFRVKNGESYYFIDAYFDVDRETELEDLADSKIFNTCNYFKTKEEAEAMAEKTKLMFEMTARVKELNGDWVADWEDYGQKKWGIDSGIDGLITECYVHGNASFIFGLSVQSKEHAEILLEEFKKRIEKYY